MSETIVSTVGWSTQTDATRAGSEAADMALSRLSFRGPQLAFVFGSSWFDQPALLRGVRSILHQTPLIGGSTAGEIVPEGPISHSCVVLLIGSTALSWSVGYAEGADRAPREAGQKAAFDAMKEFQGVQRLGCLMIGDGLVTGSADVVRGIQEVLGTSSLIVGGLAGDDMRFAQTYQYCNSRIISRGVAAVLLGGAGKIGVGLQHGFAPISKPRHITRAQANVLIELDHQPAASVYEEYFGADLVQRMRREGVSRQGIAYPLGIQSETDHYWLLRTVVSFREDGSLACSGEIPEGSWLQLMIGNRELAVEAARVAAQEAIQSLNRVAAVLVFDSAIRRKLLGSQHAAMEIACIRQVIGPSVTIAGCYTYGQQAPLGQGSAFGRIAVQTGSVLVVAIGT